MYLKQETVTVYPLVLLIVIFPHKTVHPSVIEQVVVTWLVTTLADAS